MRKSLSPGAFCWRHWLFLVLVSCVGCGSGHIKPASTPGPSTAAPASGSTEEAYDYESADGAHSAATQSLSQRAKDSAGEAAPAPLSPPPPPGVPGREHGCAGTGTPTCPRCG
jgi:hypothetical protein